MKDREKFVQMSQRHCWVKGKGQVDGTVEQEIEVAVRLDTEATRKGRKILSSAMTDQVAVIAFVEEIDKEF